MVCGVRRAACRVAAAGGDWFVVVLGISRGKVLGTAAPKRRWFGLRVGCSVPQGAEAELADTSDGTVLDAVLLGLTLSPALTPSLTLALCTAVAVVELAALTLTPALTPALTLALHRSGSS